METKSNAQSKAGGLVRDTYTGITRSLTSIDLFARPIPSFTLGGNSEVRTWYGGLCSFMIVGITIMFALSKVQ